MTSHGEFPWQLPAKLSQDQLFAVSMELPCFPPPRLRVTLAPLVLLETTEMMEEM